MTKKLIDLTTPGEILKEEFLTPLNINGEELANHLEIPASRVSEIIRGKRTISLDTAMRLSIYFKTTPQFWINLQTNYDLQKIKEENPAWLHTIRPLRKKRYVGSSLKRKKTIL